MTAYLPSLSGELGRPVSTFYVLKTLASVIFGSGANSPFGRLTDRARSLNGCGRLRVTPTSANLGRKILTSPLPHVLAV